jgi:hypothetical protein
MARAYLGSNITDPCFKHAVLVSIYRPAEESLRYCGIFRKHARLVLDK